jgi:hypothetical protein
MKYLHIAKMPISKVEFSFNPVKFNPDQQRIIDQLKSLGFHITRASYPDQRYRCKKRDVFVHLERVTNQMDDAEQINGYDKILMTTIETRHIVFAVDGSFVTSRKDFEQLDHTEPEPEPKAPTRRPRQPRKTKV